MYKFYLYRGNCLYDSSILWGVYQSTMVPLLSIPEAAYDSQAYLLPRTSRSNSQLIRYLLTLTRTSSVALIILYIIGYFAVKPALEIGGIRRLEVLDLYRLKLRDLYINLIGKVSQIPIVAFNRTNGKCYVDAITQTTESSLGNKTDLDNDKLGQANLLATLTKLSESLPRCIPYLTEGIPHYKLTNASIRDLQNKADLKYFNTSDFFNIQVDDKGKTRTRDVVVETKNEIRGIKGLYMSGQA